MRTALVTYFDLGESFGLGDNAFIKETVNLRPDIGRVPVRSPLGWGATTTVPESVLVNWRREALTQIWRHDAVDVGWVGPPRKRQQFDLELATYVGGQEVDFCKVTVFAIGTAYLHLQFHPSIPLKYARGLLSCFEFAAYTKEISTLIAGVAYKHACAGALPTAASVRTLTKRQPPREEPSSKLEVTLFSAFTHIYLCVDDGDEKILSQLLRLHEVARQDCLPFDRGTLHYTWPSCILEPQSIRVKVPPLKRAEDLEQMLEDIKIAHSFLGTCEAYMNLIRDEIVGQAVSNGLESRRPRSSIELNKLRKMAVAAVNLTDFGLVSQAEEDHRYFNRFTESAKLGEIRDRISNAADVLYEVQAIEHQEETSRRERMLNLLLVVLALLTVFSVVVDVGTFLDAQPGSYGVLVVTTTAVVLAVLGFLISLVLNWQRLLRWWHSKRTWRRTREESARRTR